MHLKMQLNNRKQNLQNFVLIFQSTIGIGGQLGNKNAFKHGYYCKESIAQRSEIHKMLKEYRQLCGEIDSI